MSAAAAQAHRPVLLEASIEALAVRPDGRYVDATFGRGGHSAAILERLGEDGGLLALDRDPEAVAVGRARFGDDPRFCIRRAAFSSLAEQVEALGWSGSVDGVLLDLGVSSPQLDDAGRGFSFMRPGPLDMRMDPDAGESAAEWLNRAGEREIARVLFEYGEERFSRRIARRIVEARDQGPLATTDQLVALIEAAVPRREPGKHPATRSFQAIRIRVNRELEELDAVLEQAVAVLAPGGRLAVISFHSLEDRRVKRFIRAQARGRELPPEVPVTGEPEGRTLKPVGRQQRADAEECRANPRARSAVLRVAERL